MPRLSLIALLLLPLPASAADKPVTVDVWPGKPPGHVTTEKEKMELPKPKDRFPVKRLSNVSKPTLTVFRPAKGKETGTALVIAPGGGYNILAWDLEGTEVAEWLNGLGVTAIILKYRVPRPPGTKDDAPAEPLHDAQRAVSLVRSKAKDWGIDPKRIGMLGFSAGGHLTAATATGFDKRSYKAIDAVDRESCRPDFAVLVYPAYMITKDKKSLKSSLPVTKKTPPMFLVHAANDGVPSENSVQMYLALRKAGVSAELHVYATGGHGYGLRPSKEACSTWPKRCEAWLKGQGWLKKK